MEIRYYEQPQMLLETIELLYAFVNRIPPVEVAGHGLYCIPAESLQQIMDTCCAEIDRNDTILRFFFEKESLNDDSDNETCIARNMLFSLTVLSDGDLHTHMEQACEYWKSIRNKHICFTNAGPYGLGINVAEDMDYIPLAQSVRQLPVSAYYSQKLLEVFSGFDFYAEQLERLLLPVARKLQPMLEPWIERAAPLADAWRKLLMESDLQEIMLKCWRIYFENSTTCFTFALRCMDAQNAPGRLEGRSNTAQFHIGLAFPMCDCTAPEPEEWEIKAFHLLGSSARLKMLQTVAKQPMSSREMAQQLGLHLGTVCRDVTSLYDARLITVHMIDGRTRYGVNPAAVDILIKRLGMFLLK